MKKALSLILAAVMIAMLLPASAFTALATNSAEVPAGAVEISTAEQLLAIDGTESGKYYVLKNSISLGGATYNYSPIKLNASTFDGAGYSITDFSLKCNNVDHLDVSLFEVKGADVTIKDLTLGAEGKPIAFTISDTWNEFGTAVGSVPSGTTLKLTNTVAYVNITVSSGGGNARNVGGLVGDVAGKAVLNGCKAYGTITDNTNSGDPRGTAGILGGAYSEAAVVELINCENNVNVTGSYKKLGGLMGASSAATISMTGCVNNGEIKSSSDLIGGFIGQYFSNGANLATSYTFTNCINNGAITGNTSVAAFIGETNTVAKAKSGKLTFTGCVNNGTVTATTGHAAAISGYFKTNDGIEVNGFVNKGALTAGNNVGVVFGQASDGKTYTISLSGITNLEAITSTGGGASVFIGWNGLKLNDVTVTNCSNRGNITAKNRAGGFAGGELGSLTVTNYKNYASITGNGGNAAGSLGGDITVYGEIKISDSANYGTVNVPAGTYAAGGFFGKLTAKTSVTVTNCANYGNVTSKGENAGGFAGSNNVAAGTMTINGFLNTGAISGTAKRGGAITGNHGGSAAYVIKNAVNLGATSSAWNTGAFGWIDAAGSVTVDGCVNAGTVGKNIAAIVGIKEGITTSLGETAANAYLASTLPSGQATNNATALADIDAVISFLNKKDADTDTYANPFAPYKATAVDANEKAVGIVTADPVLSGYQMGKPSVNTDGDEVVSIRFIGTIGNTLRYKEIGIAITINGKTIEKNSRYVYNKLTATGMGGEQLEYDAKSLGGTYAFALTLTDIPTEGDIVMTVQPYAIDTDGTEYRNTTAYTFTVSNGTVTSVVAQ